MKLSLKGWLHVTDLHNMISQQLAIFEASHSSFYFFPIFFSIWTSFANTGMKLSLISLTGPKLALYQYNIPEIMNDIMLWIEAHSPPYSNITASLLLLCQNASDKSATSASTDHFLVQKHSSTSPSPWLARAELMCVLQCFGLQETMISHMLGCDSCAWCSEMW